MIILGDGARGRCEAILTFQGLSSFQPSFWTNAFLRCPESDVSNLLVRFRVLESYSCPQYIVGPVGDHTRVKGISDLRQATEIK